MVKNTLPLDFDLFERMMIYNAIFDSIYLESIIEYAKPSYFKNKDIRIVFETLHQYFYAHGKVPNITELKAHLEKV